jgi:hypothetical protein
MTSAHTCTILFLALIHFFHQKERANTEKRENKYKEKRDRCKDNIQLHFTDARSCIFNKSELHIMDKLICFLNKNELQIFVLMWTSELAF